MEPCMNRNLSFTTPDVRPLTPSLSPSDGERVPGRAGEGPAASLSSLRCLCLVAAGVLISQLPVRAVDFHVATAQDLQNALTLAASNGADDNIYLTNGYYVGNFNFNSAEARNLTLLPEPGLTNAGIIIDGAGGGRALNLANSAGGNTITVQGITFLRNCGSSSSGALRIGVGTAATISVSGCQFLSPTNTSGMGLEIASGQSVAVSGCTVIGSTSGGGGIGISVSGVSGNVMVQSCVIATNRGFLVNGGGLSIGAASLATITNNTISGNALNGGNGGGVYCAGAALLCGNTLTGNSAVYYYNGNTYGGTGGGAYCGGTATLTNNTFTGNSCNSVGGGGAYCGGTAMLTRNSFISNSTGGGPGGGGAYCGGTATLNGNTFTGNSASHNGDPSFGGGAAYCQGAATLSGNTFSSNSSGSSGGGALCSGTATLNGNTFSYNSATKYHGGGLSCRSGGTLTGNTFSGNSCAANGGGVYITGGTPTVSSNTFKQNSATSVAGGIYASASTITVLDNLVAKNTSGTGGAGGIWVNATSNLFLINNTITANNSTGVGGGVAFQVSGVVEFLNVYNNIIWGNTATGSGGDVFLTGTGQKKVFNFNDVDSMSGVWDIAVNNIDVSPQFFDPVNGDYHVRSTSLCINAGTNGAPSLSPTDLDGAPRIADNTVDLGCYEFSNTSGHPADVNNDWMITDAEYTAYAAAWKNDQTWATAPNPIPADYVTRAGYLKSQSGGAYHNDGSTRPVCWKPGAP